MFVLLYINFYISFKRGKYMHVRLIKIHQLIAATARWVKMFEVLDYNNGLSEIENILPQS
jgi:hypothetical protein